MDDVPFLFVDAVLHCLNSESLSAPRLLADPLWSSVADEHHRKREDYDFRLSNFLGMHGCSVHNISDHRECFEPEQWLRNDMTYVRIRRLLFTSLTTPATSSGTLTTAEQCSLQMVPYLNDLEDIISEIYLGGENERFEFLWKRPCHTFCYSQEDISALGWHIENNEKLKCVNTSLYSYYEVRHLLPLCAEKRLTWTMRFPHSFHRDIALLPYFVERLRNAQWDEIYPTVTNDITYVVPAQPEKGSAFYEDEHVRKEFLWESYGGSSLTITWK
uniref:F-box domain-containing protein n=1 Tax=Steinernema glaseri TaxID=37863 RepID=A0A1I7Z0I1_9BILA